MDNIEEASEKILQRINELTFANVPNITRMIQSESGKSDVINHIIKLMTVLRYDLDRSIQQADKFYSLNFETD
ncbi:MAG: hypothetical protein ACRDE2_00165 [Chitinophagaceae bacterium]